ncbi:MAG: hypothetical protein A2648_02500 [Candidatus Lloydbacteria bacterium RIFCSPHIGHO2_01_FULL_41_20]|uniref:HicB family protein n=1 Tax=Candidatus Lloydbacteria bacterium RIFCSPHIGHO2_01_FULL_41_20 TaxID=1798657 RepID=A0A1G2CRG8_9BACT|nr:MAG: hypothetical protein A2648_02500 [Candidatus Lloydbacteria bacterium RIFCSPHIGHO2_01_FULL_41_20]
MKKITLKNITWKEGGFYVAQCLNIDVSSFGKTKKQALYNLKEALELYFEGTRKSFRGIAKVEAPTIANTSFYA